MTTVDTRRSAEREEIQWERREEKKVVEIVIFILSLSIMWRFSISFTRQHPTTSPRERARHTRERRRQQIWLSNIFYDKQVLSVRSAVKRNIQCGNPALHNSYAHVSNFFFSSSWLEWLNVMKQLMTNKRKDCFAQMINDFLVTFFACTQADYHAN